MTDIIELAVSTGALLIDELNPSETEVLFNREQLTKFAQLLQQGEAVACERCGEKATKNIIYTNISQTEHPICERCAWEHEQTANEINQHEIARFGGAYGLVTFQYTPLHTPPDTQKKII